MSTSVSSVRVPGCSASAVRVTLPGKVRSGDFGNVHDGIDSRAQSERLLLRHVDLGPDHVALHDGEHERAAGRIGLHQAADVDIALSDDAVERGNNALIGLLLIEHLKQGLLRRHIGLRDADRGIARLEGQPIGISLLRSHPPFVDQRAVALPCHLRQVLVRPRLLHRCFVLDERRLGLGDLMIKLRAVICASSSSGLDAVADVDVALVDIAAGASKDVRRRERQGGGGQCDGHGGAARLHGRHANARHEVAALLGSRRDLALL